MFIYKAGTTVGKGTYWNPDTKQRQVVEDEGCLNGTGWFMRFPESWLLVPVVPMGLVLSVALPYGLGVMLFLAIGVAYTLMYETMCCFEEVFGAPLRALGRELVTWLTFGMRPTAATFDGTGRTRRGKKDRKDN